MKPWDKPQSMWAIDSTMYATMHYGMAIIGKMEMTEEPIYANTISLSFEREGVGNFGTTSPRPKDKAQWDHWVEELQKGIPDNLGYTRHVKAILHDDKTWDIEFLEENYNLQ